MPSGLTRSVVVGATIAGCYLVSLATVAHAAGPPWSSLLQLAWNGSRAEQRQELDAAYQQLRGNGATRWVDDAYLLGLVKQRRYEDAVQWLDQHGGEGEVSRLDLFRGRTHVWLLTATKRYEAAMVRMAELLTDIASHPADAWTPAQHSFVPFAGRLTGFLLGPANLPAAQRLWEDSVARAVQQLPAAAQAEFKAAQVSVLQHYQRAAAEVQQLRDQEKQQLADAKQNARAQLDRESLEIQRRQQELEREQDELKKTLRTQLQELALRDTALATRMSELGLTADTLFDAVVRTEWGIQNLINLYQTTGDDYLAFWWLTEIDRLDFRQNRQYSALRSVDREAARTQLQRNLTQREASLAKLAFGEQAQQLDQERKYIVQWQKQLANREKKLEKPVSKISRDTVVKQQALRNLSTYEPYPSEVVRTFLLQQTKVE